MDKEIFIHPIFNDLLNNFQFFFVGINMMSTINFQKALIDGHEGKKSELGISVGYNDSQCLKYDVADVLNSFNKAVHLKSKGDIVEANIIGLMNFQARQISISLFNLLENSEFSNSINRTEIFKFVKHIRNGSAHNNKFNFESKAKKELPVTWRNKTIETNLHSSEVFNKFLSPIDLVLLMADLSEMIKKIK